MEIYLLVKITGQINFSFISFKQIRVCMPEVIAKIWKQMSLTLKTVQPNTVSKISFSIFVTQFI